VFATTVEIAMFPFATFLGFDGLDAAFVVCALIGGLLYLGWLVLQFVGADGGSDVDMDVDVGGGHVHLDSGSIEASTAEVSGTADISFTMMSFQGISSFLTMFGLAGLTLHSEMGLAPAIALLGGAAAGAGTAYALGRLFAMAQRLQSSGTIKMANAIGNEATVYLTIPSSGIGKIRITLQGRLGVYDATSGDAEPIPTGTTVRVVKVVDGALLHVERVVASAPTV